MGKLQITIYALLLVSISVMSCKGQNRTEQANKTVVAPLSFTSKDTKLTKTQGTDQYRVVACSIRDRAGNLWLGTTGEGVYRYDGKVFTQFTEKDGLCDNLIFLIFEDKEGNIWLGSKTSISLFDGKKFTNRSIPGSIGSNVLLQNAYNTHASRNNELWSMMQDRSGTIWLGTTDGIYCYDGKSFTRFLEHKNILNTEKVQLKWTQCIFEDKSGNIWFGSWVLANEGICRYDGKSITQYKPYGEGWVRSILEDKNGALLIVSRHNGVCRFDGEHFINITKKGGIENTSITSALKDKAGNLWFGTELGSGELNEDGGLWRYDGKSFTHFTRKDGLCHNGVFSMVEGTDGNIWLGTRNIGLCRFDGHTLLQSSIRSASLLGDDYKRADGEDSRFKDFAGAIQSMVTSTAQNDSGLFETNLHDDKYLPFEGAGAISNWKIELPNALPQFDFETISDVVLHIRYTCREAGHLKAAASAYVKGDLFAG